MYSCFLLRISVKKVSIFLSFFRIGLTAVVFFYVKRFEKVTKSFVFISVPRLAVRLVLYT